MDWVSIGKKIKQQREFKGLFQSDMARILNISQPCYSCYESGKKRISFSKLKKICIILNINMNDL